MNLLADIINVKILIQFTVNLLQNLLSTHLDSRSTYPDNRLFQSCMFCFSIKDTRKESRSNGIYCVLILALAAIIAVSVALAVVVIRNEENDKDSSQKAEAGANMQTPHALPSTTTDPNIITSTRGTRKSVRFTYRVFL